MKRLARTTVLALLALSFSARAPAHLDDPAHEPTQAPARAAIRCEDGFAAEYPCENVDLLAFVPLASIQSSGANDIWGWTDAETGVEYALLGLREGTAFFDLADPTAPRHLGTLPSTRSVSNWRDIKVYAGHAFIVSEARGHGMQVFDLRQLREVENPPVVFQSDAVFRGFGTAHNLAINDETGFAYALGTNRCNGGLYMIDVNTPSMPSPAGCFGDDFYTHDAQCVVYRGPDRDHQGREICFNANTDTLTIVDVTEKTAPVMLSRTPYEGSSYAHQGWLTEDHAHFLLGDELDELRRGQRTRTFVWDVGDLDAPALNGFHESESAATDHNLYVRGNHVFQANYRSGVRILRLGDLAVSELAEVAFFDTDPDSDAPSFLGIWGTYPWLESGVLIASDRRRGLFVLRPDLEAVPECWDGIDNDGDGRRDHPDDTTCLRPESPYEGRRVDVRIAVAPYGREGVIRLDARRPVAVLIRGSRTVDVRQVDVEGLRFGPAAAAPRLHPGRSGWPRRLRFRPRDVDGDGHPDLLMHFGAAALGLAPSDVEACLAGEIRGDPFESCDAVEVLAETCHGGRRASRPSRGSAAQASGCTIPTRGVSDWRRVWESRVERLAGEKRGRSGSSGRRGR